MEKNSKKGFIRNDQIGKNLAKSTILCLNLKPLYFAGGYSQYTSKIIYLSKYLI